MNLRRNNNLIVKEGLEEEPGVQPYVDFLTRKKPEPGEYIDKVTRRCGVIGVKVGMTRFWDSYWQEVPLTMIYVNILIFHLLTISDPQLSSRSSQISEQRWQNTTTSWSAPYFTAQSDKTTIGTFYEAWNTTETCFTRIQSYT